MRPYLRHCWSLSHAEAIRLQENLAADVVREDVLDPIRHVAGVDVAFDRASGNIYAAVAIVECNTFEPVEIQIGKATPTFPALPGVEAFRELPAIVEALEKLRTTPEFIICASGGVAHARRFGPATHLGVLFNVPTIGCTKTRQYGKLAGELAPERGAKIPLIDRDETIGYALRTREGERPVFVSPGHRISLASTCDWILKMTPASRLPETSRLVDKALQDELRRSQ